MESGAVSEEVIAAAKSGSGRAFAVIYRVFAPSVLGYLTSKGVDDAEDATNDVFLAVLPQLSSVTGGVVGLKKFVFTVAHARMVDHTRRAARRPPSVPYSLDLDIRFADSAETTALASFEGSNVKKLLEQLPTDQREVLLLRLVAELSLADTAAVMGRSQGSVKQLQRRGLLSLRAQIDERGTVDVSQLRLA